MPVDSGRSKNFAGSFGRVRGAREIVVRPNYVMVYRVAEEGDTLAILRVLHAAQRWP